MAWGSAPFVNNPFLPHRVEITPSDSATLHEGFGPSSGTECAERGMPVGIAHGKVPLDRRRNFNRACTQRETLKAFGLADRTGNALQSPDRFADKVDAIEIRAHPGTL